MATAETIIHKAQVQLSQVPGIGVQLYSEDKLYGTLEIVYDIVRDEYTWLALCSYDRDRALDGSTGHLVGTVPWTSYEQIICAWRDNEIEPLKTLGRFDNPNIVGSGTRARYIVPDASHATSCQFLPPEATGNITTMYEAELGTIEPSTEMRLDTTMLVLYVCWFYSQSEGFTPGDVEKFRSMAEKRFAQMKEKNDRMARELDPRAPYAMDQWWSPSDY